jgi:hypothetical protein
MTNDMTKGAITPLLIRFTIPLVLGNLFQLTYNAADSIIVGKFVGEEALAAVGTSNPLMTLAILFINGICLGAGILVSTAFGAGDTRLVERQVSTTAIAGTVFSLAFSALCVILATPLLQLMQVPADILPIAASYLRIVFAGLIFTFFYNFLAATMRALGDSKSALYFLMISSVLNIGGDLFFVQVLNWGSNGCALSTVVSEALCCVLCVLYIRWKVPILQLGRRWLVFDGKLLRKTVSYGWASAMQQATVQLGKIAVQAIVNTMGVNAMAAFTAASRIDDFAYTPQQNIGQKETLYDKVIKQAAVLTKLRSQSGKHIERQMQSLLVPLGMPNVRFVVELNPRKEPDSKGMDSVTFLFSANKNGTLQNVASVASGGEIARVMLSLKAMIAGAVKLPTIIFDEIDTGVSGSIAEKMALIMQEMGKQNRQVISITHLPQIAARGITHYKVYKEDTETGTNSHIRRLTDEERVKEIANMLSGATLTEAALNNAKALISGCWCLFPYLPNILYNE